MTQDIDKLEQAETALDRLVRFAEGGESGFKVYPGGIFVTDGANPFYSDLRSLISQVREAQSRVYSDDEARRQIGNLEAAGVDWMARAQAAEAALAPLKREVRTAVERLIVVQHAAFGLQAGDEPDVYTDYDRLCEHSRWMSEALRTLALLSGGMEGGSDSTDIAAAACDLTATEPPSQSEECTTPRCAECSKTANPACFCDRSGDGVWCRQCFALTPCGRDEHGEGCPTIMWSDEPQPLADRLRDYADGHGESVVACELMREAADALDEPAPPPESPRPQSEGEGSR